MLRPISGGPINGRKVCPRMDKKQKPASKNGKGGTAKK
jgi:hypothetical protein